MVLHEYREARFRPGSSGRLDPLGLVMGLVRADLFDDYVVYEKNGTWVYAGGALTTVSLDAHEVRTISEGRRGQVSWSGSPGAALRVALASAPVAGGNAYGVLDFEFAALLPSLAQRRMAAPEGELARLIVPRAEVRVDADGVVSRTIGRGLDATIREVLETDGRPALCGATPVDVREDGGNYRERVAQAAKEIQAGAYQKVILSRVVGIPFAPDFGATYETGRRANTPARSFLVCFDGFQAAGFSPEAIVTVDPDGTVTTRPLAGTRASGRIGTVDLDASNVCDDALRSDPKEVFEHALSVYAAQGELRAVCRPDTVGIRDFMSVTKRGSVHHLASRVGGRLTDSSTAWDALEAVFPAVTASGIPKRESLDAIFRLEGTRRGLYAGSVLSVTHDGALDAALVLRAIYEKDGRAWLRAGAGIITGSTPEREFEETCEKLASIAPFVVPRQEPGEESIA
jgi:salicylate synthetase